MDTRGNGKILENTGEYSKVQEESRKILENTGEYSRNPGRYGRIQDKIKLY